MYATIPTALHHRGTAVAWWLPRGLILIEDIDYNENDTWSVKLHYFDEDGNSKGGTHYHESYRSGWVTSDRSQLRKLGVPIGDWTMAEGALYLAMDLRDRDPDTEVRKILNTSSGDVSFYEASDALQLRPIGRLAILHGRCRDSGATFRDLARETLDLIRPGDVESAFITAREAVVELLPTDSPLLTRFNVAAEFDPDDPLSMLRRCDQAAVLLEAASVFVPSAATPGSAKEAASLVTGIGAEAPHSSVTAARSVGNNTESPEKLDDELHRLTTARVTADKHRSLACPSCGRNGLTVTDRLDLEHDALERTFHCAQCRYRAAAFGMPFSEWPDGSRDAWYAKAAKDHAREAIIRCPNCGNDSIVATGSEVRGVGTSTHVSLRCTVRGCNLGSLRVERSIYGTGRAHFRAAALLAIVLVGAALVAFLFTQLRR